MDLNSLILSLIPSWTSAGLLVSYFVYLAIFGSILPGKIIPGATLSDGTCLHYRCNGLLQLILLVLLLAGGVTAGLVSPTVIADRGLELLSATFIFSIIVTLLLNVAGRGSRHHDSSLKPHVSGNLIHDWWFGIQLNPQCMGIDLKFFFVRAGMLGWLLINLSVLAKSILDENLNRSMVLYQLYCTLYILDYFFYEEYMTSTWDIIAERLGFMLVFGDLVWIPFTFSIQGWWLLKNNVELTTAGKTVIAEYLRRRGCSPSPNISSAPVSSNLQAYVKPQSDEVFTGGAKKPSRAQKEASSSSSLSNHAKSDATVSGNIQPSKSRKKKGKVISLAEAAKGSIVFQQGKPCLCQARRHNLISNCLSCGKIVCEQEGEGPCQFCGALVLQEGSNYAGLEVSEIPFTEAEVAANAYAKRLVDFDRNAAARTSVIDDQSDYYDEGNSWLSMEEKELLRKKQEEIEEAEAANRKKVVVAFDLVGRRVLLNKEDISELDSGLNILRPSDVKEVSRVKPNPSLQVQPIFMDPGPSEKLHKAKGSGKGLNKGLCLEISGRVQHDKSELKRYVDDHIGSSSGNDRLEGHSWSGISRMEDDADCSAY